MEQQPKRKTFTLREVQACLGVAPSIADRIAGLLNGTVQPNRFHSLAELQLEPWAVRQEGKVLALAAAILEGEVKELGDELNTLYVDLGMDHLPTVILSHGQFILCPIEEFCEEYIHQLPI